MDQESNNLSSEPSLERDSETGSAEKYRRLFMRFAFLRAGIFGILNFALNLYRLYLEKIMNKPRSSRIFSDASLPIGLLRQNILKGLGIPSKDLRNKPMIGVANSWCELNPGHRHL